VKCTELMRSLTSIFSSVLAPRTSLERFPSNRDSHSKYNQIFKNPLNNFSIYFKKFFKKLFQKKNSRAKKIFKKTQKRKILAAALADGDVVDGDVDLAGPVVGLGPEEHDERVRDLPESDLGSNPGSDVRRAPLDLDQTGSTVEGPDDDLKRNFVERIWNDYAFNGPARFMSRIIRLISLINLMTKPPNCTAVACDLL